MSPTRATLGRCPHCGAGISDERTLIQYERHGDSSVWAACPDCDAVVHPA